MATKKLIEVALPLEQINAAAEYEKMPGIGPHPRGIHHWWARRPFTTARAIIWACLVDDPSSDVLNFPTEKEQIDERKRLFGILSDLVDWKNSSNEQVLKEAKEEIIKSTKGRLPELLDPFAGGGAIPFEASRLGLIAHAHDLNPVAVMINKSLLEIISRFDGCKPVNPLKRAEFGVLESHWSGADIIASDLEYYGSILREEAFSKLKSNYPRVKIPSTYGGGETNVVAWIWTRTVRCPNPSCGCELPLMKSYVLSSKKGGEAYIKPYYINGKLEFDVVNQKYPGKKSGTVSRSGVICPCCNMPVNFDYIREQGKANKMATRMAAVVAEGKRRKLYLRADAEQEAAADIEISDDIPTGEISYYPGCLNTNAYGLDRFELLFSNRQMVSLLELSNALKAVQRKIESDAIGAGYPNDHISLSHGGNGALAISEAIVVYLAFAIDRVANFANTATTWSSSNEKVMFLFNRQAISMTWDYPECNIFGNAVGSFLQVTEYIADCIKTFPHNQQNGQAQQVDAQTDCGLRNVMVSTDPPYYDNVPYADLADFFYIWLRHNIKDIYPDLFSTLMTPKKEEIVAQRYRFDGDVEKAKTFFEEGMLNTCKQIYKYAGDDFPVTIYYAYKQSEIDEDDNKASSGWETMLNAIISSGFIITGTWPVRTEQTYRALSLGQNTLASSIILVCRKRQGDAPQITRRNLVNTLRRELRPALKKLQESNIAPVDLAQSAIGPGMAVFSRYRKALEADGSAMSVRSALQVINEEIDLYFNEQVGDLDAMSRFCVDLYTQSAFNDIKFGDADILSRAKGTSVAALASHDVVYAKAGTVHLIERTELTEKIDNNESCIWLLTQQLTQAMATGGVEACAKAVFMMFGSNAERAKDLAYRLYTIAEQKKWANEAFAYNALVVAWPDIQSRAAMMQRETPEQMDMFSMGLLNT